MFIGSIPNHIAGFNQEIHDENGQLIVEYSALFTAAHELGYTATERGHRILIGSDSPRTIDFYLAAGVRQYCDENLDSRAHIEVHWPQTDKPIYNDMPENVHVLYNPHHAAEESAHKWIVSHSRALDEADAVVALGGGISTNLIGHLAADKGKPTVALPIFGGTSEQLFHSLRYRYQSNPDLVVHMPFLTSPWKKDTASHVIQFTESLATKLGGNPHTYFISYAWDDCQVADHLETLLRRENRPVIRDETNVRSGVRLTKQVEALIEESDTFIALWGEAFNNSRWCPNELDFALQLNHENGRPSRIALLKVDDHRAPVTYMDYLFLPAKERKERELAIGKLLKEEQ